MLPSGTVYGKMDGYLGSMSTVQLIYCEIRPWDQHKFHLWVFCELLLVLEDPCNNFAETTNMAQVSNVFLHTFGYIAESSRISSQ